MEHAFEEGFRVEAGVGGPGLLGLGAQLRAESFSELFPYLPELFSDVPFSAALATALAAALYASEPLS